MARVVASGDNFTMTLSRGVVHLAVVRRPDLTLEQGAQNARDMLAAQAALLADATQRTTALILDLSEAPLAGPDTRKTLGEMIARWATAGCRVAVLVTHPTMRMLFARLLAEHAPQHGQVFAELRPAQLWAAGLPLDLVTTSGEFRRIERSGGRIRRPDDDS